MKQILLIVATAFLTSTVSAQEIPSQIQSYINQHFNGMSVTKYKTKFKPHKAKYKVYLDNDVKVEFNSDFKPTEMESDSGLPESVIPAKLLNYVKQKYPDMKIVEWELKSRKQEIELENGLELEFDLAGNFLRIDD